MSKVYGGSASSNTSLAAALDDRRSVEADDGGRVQAFCRDLLQCRNGTYDDRGSNVTTGASRRDCASAGTETALEPPEERDFFHDDSPDAPERWDLDIWAPVDRENLDPWAASRPLWDPLVWASQLDQRSPRNGYFAKLGETQAGFPNLKAHLKILAYGYAAAPLSAIAEELCAACLRVEEQIKAPIRAEVEDELKAAIRALIDMPMASLHREQHAASREDATRAQLDEWVETQVEALAEARLQKRFEVAAVRDFDGEPLLAIAHLLNQASDILLNIGDAQGYDADLFSTCREAAGIEKDNDEGIEKGAEESIGDGEEADAGGVESVVVDLPERGDTIRCVTRVATIALTALNDGYEDAPDAVNDCIALFDDIIEGFGSANDGGQNDAAAFAAAVAPPGPLRRQPAASTRSLHVARRDKDGDRRTVEPSPQRPAADRTHAEPRVLPRWLTGQRAKSAMVAGLVLVASVTSWTASAR